MIHYTFHLSHWVLYIVNAQLILFSESDNLPCRYISNPQDTLRHKAFVFPTNDPWKVEGGFHAVSYFPPAVI